MSEANERSRRGLPRLAFLCGAMLLIVGAIISAGKKVVAATKNGESVFKVAV